MKANSHSTSLLKVGEVAERLGCSVQSVRNWVEDGSLKSIRSPGGHRLIPESSVREFLGYDEVSDIVEAGIPICLCGRVSTPRQASRKATGESDLDRQTAKLRDWVTANHPTARVTEYIAVRSGLNFSDKTFVRMLEDILNGKFRGGFLVCSHRDRVCRLSGDFLTLICRKGECELVEVDEESERSFAESIADELLSLTHVFSCRHYARRSAEANTKHCSDEAIRRMVELRQKNMGIEEIVRTLNVEGFRMGKGTEQDSWDEPITEWCVLRWLDSNGVEKGITTLLGYENKEGDLLDAFINENIEKTGEKSDRLTGVEIRECYARWCEERNLVPEEKSIFGAKLVKKGFVRGRIGKQRFFVGVRLN